MTKDTKRLIASYLQKYLEYKRPDIKIGKDNLFECPFADEHKDKDKKPSCKIYSKYGYKLKCFNSSHGELGNIFDVFRKYESSMASFSDEDIVEYLTKLLDIQENKDVDELFTMYSNSGFGLIALQPNSKNPVSGQSWLKNTSYDINIWKEWYDNNLGFGLRLGQASNVVAIDIDSQETLKKMKNMMGNTAMQSTLRGFHFLYSYEEWMSNIQHINFRNKGYEMELRANNAYIVVAPTIVDDYKRKWNDIEITQMPKELKDLLLSLIDKPKKEKTLDESIKEAINKEDIGIKNGLVGLDGECNEAFIKLGGLLRKKLSPEQVEWSLYNFNKLLADPMDNKSIKAMGYQLKKYDNFDKKELAEQVLNHLKILETSTARDLRDSLKQDKKDIEEVLSYLVKEEKLRKYGRVYKYIPKVDWETDFMDMNKSLKIEVPYFDKYARFENGSMIIIGASTGQGKTTLACNFIKKFVDKDIVPYYLCTEAGSRFKLVTARLGMKVGDYKFKITNNATDIELEDNAVTILDWLKPNESNYAMMDTIMERLNNQLVKHGGLLIVFVQLRKDNGVFFAPDLIDFYASLVAKYRWTKLKQTNGEVIYDNENTSFKTEKIRDSKCGQQYITIPIFFNKETKLITLRGEK